jgi:hypothetical protein
MLALFKRQLNVSTPNPDGYSQELFAQVSQLYLPTLSDSGKRHSGEMSDLLLCLKQQETAEQPQAYDCKIFDAVYAHPTTRAVHSRSMQITLHAQPTTEYGYGLEHIYSRQYKSQPMNKGTNVYAGRLEVKQNSQAIGQIAHKTPQTNNNYLPSFLL